MTTKPTIDLLRRLCETPGIAGREERVRQLIQREVKGLFDDVREDALGSLICTRKPAGGTTRRGRTSERRPTRVMLAAHMDEIGFYVRHVDERGFVWINPAGGFDPRTLFARRVMVCTETGDFIGALNPGGKPIHILSDEDRKKIPPIEEFFIDLGMEAAEVKRRVRIGDFVVLHEPFVEQPVSVMSKALDNRVACYVAIETARRLARGKGPGHDCELVIVFTTQEEVGLRGAMTAAHAVGADIGVGLDITLACDTPGVEENQRVTRQGDGVALMVQDSSMISDHMLVAEFEAVARAHKIKSQRSILARGGQDGAAIQRAGAGARCGAVVVGTRYVHTVTESVRRDDLEAAIALLAAWIPTVR